MGAERRSRRAAGMLVSFIVSKSMVLMKPSSADVVDTERCGEFQPPLPSEEEEEDPVDENDEAEVEQKFAERELRGARLVGATKQNSSPLLPLPHLPESEGRCWGTESRDPGCLSGDCKAASGSRTRQSPGDIMPPTSIACLTGVCGLVGPAFSLSKSLFVAAARSLRRRGSVLQRRRESSSPGREPRRAGSVLASPSTAHRRQRELPGPSTSAVVGVSLSSTAPPDDRTQEEDTEEGKSTAEEGEQIVESIDVFVIQALLRP